MITAEDAVQRSLNGAEGLEKVSASTSEAYSARIIPPHTMLSLVADDGGIVKICRELIFDGQFGQDVGAPQVTPLDVWATDTEGANIAGRWNVAGITTNTPGLDKTEGTLSYSHGLEIKQDDQDDVFVIGASNGRSYQNFGDGSTGAGSTTIFERALRVPAGAPYVARITHKDGHGSKPMQYQAREVRGHASVTTRYWDGSAWQNTAQWIDITANTGETIFIDDVTLDEATDVVISTSDGTYVSGPAYYFLFFRPKSDYSGVLSHISNVGLCEKIAAADFDLRINANEEKIITTGPYWSRVGVITDNNSKNLYISELGTSK